MRSAASGDEMGPTHAERRGEEAAERGKAKYPSILGGGRETRSRDKGAREGGVATGERTNRELRLRRSRNELPPRSPVPQTHLQSCVLTRGEKWKEKWIGASAT